MAFSTTTVYSHTLGMDTQINILLPEKRNQFPMYEPDKKYPVLYLLHGHSDDQTAWMRKSMIEQAVEGLDLIVVMPTTHRGFYTDGKHGPNYFSYIAEELPIIVGNLFPAAKEREHTYVAGLSMGGYGAFKLAINYPDRYKAAASLSGALLPYQAINNSKGKEAFRVSDFTENLVNVFGEEKDFYGSVNDLCNKVKELDTLDVEQPLLFQCCGTEDPLTYDQNQQFKKFVEQETRHVQLVYEESPGAHTWEYWNAQIDVFLEHFKLKY